MHIDEMSAQLLDVLPCINSRADMQDFLNRYSVSDQLAILSAYRIGLRYYGYDEPKQDDEPINRAIEAHISPAEYANVLLSKRGELSNALNSFQRGLTQTQRDAF
ncbi:hypothetical protein QWU01_20465 [Kluyvera cryocrescens]|uniref:Uncharacterized protein n=1 Tax=Kluyvera cryocrescens TaxID=580 RepID=A0AAW9CBA3_KLUCR|nr:MULTISPECIES: hypothetical protein [Enterobacteriaceae]MDW3779183.1 hypothetical protein [Kluyvera cryocrescens]HCE8851230.1 hypothetical protein [Citrobacter freundii]